MYSLHGINIVPYMSPERVSISAVNLGLKEITFTWNPIPTECSAAIHYNILASNCGSCPTTTNHTNVTCTDIPTNGSRSITCSFAVRTVVCGNITGNVSEPLMINITETLTNSNKGIYICNIIIIYLFCKL